MIILSYFAVLAMTSMFSKTVSIEMNELNCNKSWDVDLYPEMEDVSVDLKIKFVQG